MIMKWTLYFLLCYSVITLVIYLIVVFISWDLPNPLEMFHYAEGRALFLVYSVFVGVYSDKFASLNS